MESQISFNLHFSDVYECWAPFKISIGHLLSLLWLAHLLVDVFILFLLKCCPFYIFGTITSMASKEFSYPESCSVLIMSFAAQTLFTSIPICQFLQLFPVQLENGLHSSSSCLYLLVVIVKHSFLLFPFINCKN